MGFQPGGYIGAVAPATLSSGAIQSGMVSSGFIAPYARHLETDTFVTGEIISGGFQAAAVAATQVSGIQVFIQTAMASVSGRMPCIGIVTSNYLSGVTAQIFRDGALRDATLNFSGWLDQPIYVGRSGQLSASGAPQSSGDVQQIVGVSVQNSGMMIQLGDALEGVIGGSGDIGSGAITGANQSGSMCIASGSIGRFDLGAGIVFSGVVVSGAITGANQSGVQCIASGSIGSFDLGNAVVGSGQTASGSLGPFAFASGAVVRAAGGLSPFVSGLNWGTPTLITGETISGVRCVGISQSGTLQVAMASVSGRSPAIGIVVDNILSGFPANVYMGGAFQLSSGLADYSGYLGKPIWCGRSGQVVSFSGSFNSGGFSVASGADLIQRMGWALNSGAIAVLPDHSVLETQLVGVTSFIDVANRGYGI